MDYKIFNVRTDVNACDCTRGCTDTVRQRVCTKSWLWEKNPLPHRGIDPSSAACRSDALPTELHHHLDLRTRILPQSFFFFFFSCFFFKGNQWTPSQLSLSKVVMEGFLSSSSSSSSFSPYFFFHFFPPFQHHFPFDASFLFSVYWTYVEQSMKFYNAISDLNGYYSGQWRIMH